MSTKSEPADAEGASPSIKDEIIRGLNEDLASNYSVCRIQQYVEGSRIRRYSRAVKKACVIGAIIEVN